MNFFRGRDKIYQAVGNLMLEPRRQVEAGKIRTGILSIEMRSDVNFTLGYFSHKKDLDQIENRRESKRCGEHLYSSFGFHF